MLFLWKKDSYSNLFVLGLSFTGKIIMSRGVQIIKWATQNFPKRLNLKNKNKNKPGFPSDQMLQAPGLVHLSDQVLSV